MIKKIKSSLTAKIFLLVALLLGTACGITYTAVVHFLPVTYSSRLEEDLDILSRNMAETIGRFSTLEEAGTALALFEAGAKVSVFILDEEGNCVWPEEETGYAAIESDTVIEEEESGYAATEAVIKAPEEESGYAATEADTVIEEEGEPDSGGTFSFISEITISGDGEEHPMTGVTVKQYELKIGGENYLMLVSGGMQPVSQAMEILREIFPYILLLSLATALIFAWGASVYLTAPVIALGKLSRKLAVLDFEDSYRGRRTDELGALGEDLNRLSFNLSKSLTDLKEANAKLKTEIELERELDRQRLAFFSAVSHELKTPVTILEGHLAGMLEGVGEYRDRDYYLKRSLATVRKMEDLVKELLTVSRMESRAAVMKRTDLAEQLRLSLAEMTELMEKKGLELVLEIPEHCWKNVDPPMMEKVFRNLLINAIRYTPEGKGDQIRIRLKESEKGIFFSMENTGVHIPEDALPHLFEAFYRVEQSRSRQTGGSGLGLYIVKRILEQYEAEYGAENTEDGVSFFFSF